MEKSKNNLLNRTKEGKSPVRQDGHRRAAKYNYSCMEDTTVKIAEGFAERLAQLRSAKGVSGREMSLSMGQAAGYVNNIENGNNLPSLAMFFEICEYLNVTPQEFFSYTRRGEKDMFKDVLRNLSSEDKDLLLRLAKRMVTHNAMGHGNRPPLSPPHSTAGVFCAIITYIAMQLRKDWQGSTHLKPEVL